MPKVYAIRGRPLPFLPSNPRWDFALSISEGARLADAAESEGRAADAAAIDAETAGYRWRRFRSKQMRLLALGNACPDFTKGLT